MQEKETGNKYSERKQDHIELALESGMDNKGPDPRFRYEPMLTAHPSTGYNLEINFLGKKLRAPLWVSSMTGGTEMALTINRRLAASCFKFGLGMGLGSCRPLLDDLARMEDFDVRDIIGPDLPLYANLGIAQVEQLLDQNRTDDIIELVKKLRTDGLIIHVNPLQEWLQPEGDRIRKPPIETVHQLLAEVSFPVIVKEVGQGMGRESLNALIQTQVAAIELAAHGGTNFSKLELLRSKNNHQENYLPISHIGHSIGEMVSWINELTAGRSTFPEIIISGGIRDFLDGYYWMKMLSVPSIYGQASAFLKYARESQEALDEYIEGQIRSLQLAHAYLKVNA